VVDRLVLTSIDSIPVRHGEQVMFQIEHPADYLNRVEDERARLERRARLLRALRGTVPPFNEAHERELRAVMREQLKAQTDSGQ
jgi:hypothetical protein